MTVLEKSRSCKVFSKAKDFCYPTFTCSKLTTETIEQSVFKVNKQDTEIASVLLIKTSGAKKISPPEKALILNTFPHIAIFSRI